MTGRGTLYNAAARLAFLVTSYAMHIALAHLLTPSQYGSYGVALSLVTLARVFLGTGIPQSATHHLARAEGDEGAAAWRLGRRLQLLGSAGITVAYLAAGTLWARSLADPELETLIVLSAPMIPFMAWYQINLAYLNGKFWFGWQAAFITAYSVFRAAFVIALVVLGHAVAGAVTGLVGAVVAVAVLSALKIPRAGDETAQVTWREMVSFSAPLVVVGIGTSVLLNLDLLLLKSLAQDERAVGFYTGAMNLGKAPYWVFYAFGMTLLPAISRAYRRDGAEAANRIARRNISYLVLAALPVAAIVATSAPELLRFVYDDVYEAGARSLSLLAVSMCALSLVGVLHAVLTGIGEPRRAMAVVVVGFPVQLVLGITLIPRLGMDGAALTNLVVVALELVLALTLAQSQLGSLLDARRLSRALVAVAPVTAFFLVVPLPTPWVPVAYAVGCAVYGALLLALGAVTREEVTRLLRRVRGAP